MKYRKFLRGIAVCPIILLSFFVLNGVDHMVFAEGTNTSKSNDVGMNTESSKLFFEMLSDIAKKRQAIPETGERGWVKFYKEYSSVLVGKWEPQFNMILGATSISYLDGTEVRTKLKSKDVDPWALIGMGVCEALDKLGDLENENVEFGKVTTSLDYFDGAINLCPRATFYFLRGSYKRVWVAENRMDIKNGFFKCDEDIFLWRDGASLDLTVAEKSKDETLTMMCDQLKNCHSGLENIMNPAPNPNVSFGYMPSARMCFGIALYDLATSRKNIWSNIIDENEAAKREKMNLAEIAEREIEEGHGANYQKIVSNYLGSNKNEEALFIANNFLKIKSWGAAYSYENGQLQNDVAMSNFLKGEAYTAMGDYQKAEHAYNDFLNICGNVSDGEQKRILGLTGLANIYWSKNTDLDKSIKYLEEACELSHQVKSWGYLNDGNTVSSIFGLPHYDHLIEMLVFIHPMYGEAMNLVNNAGNKYGADYDTRTLVLANVYVGKKEYNKAIDIYQSWLDYYSSTVKWDSEDEKNRYISYGRGQLGYIKIVSGADGKNDLNFRLDYLVKHPAETDAYYIEVGWIKYWLGDWEGGREDMEKAIKLGNKSAAYDNLGIYYWAAKKDKQRALENIQIYLENGYHDFNCFYHMLGDGYFLQDLNETPEFKELIGKYAKLRGVDLTFGVSN